MIGKEGGVIGKGSWYVVSKEGGVVGKGSWYVVSKEGGVIGKGSWYVVSKEGGVIGKGSWYVVSKEGGVVGKWLVRIGEWSVTHALDRGETYTDMDSNIMSDKLSCLHAIFKLIGRMLPNALYPLQREQTNVISHLCLIKGMFTQLAAATAAKGTHRASKGGAVCQ